NMKAILVLVICLTVTILQVKLKEPCPKDLEVDVKAFKSLWYVRAAKPDIFDEFDHIEGNLDQVNEKTGEVSGTVTANINGTYDEHDVSLIVSGRNLTSKYSTHGENFSALYEVLAFDDTFYIAYGKPSADSKGLVLIHYKDQCPGNDTQDKVKKALKNVCLDFKDFSEDKKIDC
ncbi:hypothetical protein L9F63_022922, partial [Diploptera punctata]